MPLWLIHHPTGTFEDEASKESLAKDITSAYVGWGLPAFYVIVNFIKLAGTDMYIGGRPNTGNPFIRLQIDHIAVRLDNDDAAYNRVTASIDRILKPHIEDKGYDWEYHIDETERRLWKIQGLAPPPFKSEEEKVWIEQNKPSPWEKSE